jgi:hypothetical protein
VTWRPTRATVAGRAYLDLQNLARKQRRPTDELHQIYALEGFLTRLVASPYADRFVLKGGVLLAAYDSRRPTRDIDLRGQGISSDTDQVLGIMQAIARVHIEDGLLFAADSATAEGIRDEDVYGGVRVTLTGELSVAKLSLHVDVNLGDPVWPAPQQIVLPRLLAGEIVLAGYALPMVHAEKLVTAVQRGVANTRWRDFADIYALARRHDIDGYELSSAITRVAGHRQVNLVPLSQVLDGYAPLAQQRWTAWQRKHRLDDRLPERFEQVLGTVIAFGDPAISEKVADRAWSAAEQDWLPRKH